MVAVVRKISKNVLISVTYTMVCLGQARQIADQLFPYPLFLSLCHILLSSLRNRSRYSVVIDIAKHGYSPLHHVEVAQSSNRNVVAGYVPHCSSISGLTQTMSTLFASPYVHISHPR